MKLMVAVLGTLMAACAAAAQWTFDVGGRGSGTNDTVKRYSRGGLPMFDSSVARPVAGQLIPWRSGCRARIRI